MSKPISYVLCPKCNSQAHKAYDKEEIENAYPNDVRMQVLMKREYICSEQPCSYTFQATMKQIMKAFRQKRKEEGKSNSDIIHELKTNVEEMKKQYPIYERLSPHLLVFLHSQYLDLLFF